MTREVDTLECFDGESGVPPCPRCGCPAWIVDGHAGSYWLLCLDLNHAECFETRELPEDVTVIDRRTA